MCRSPNVDSVPQLPAFCVWRRASRPRRARTPPMPCLGYRSGRECRAVSFCIASVVDHICSYIYPPAVRPKSPQGSSAAVSRLYRPSTATMLPKTAPCVIRRADGRVSTATLSRRRSTRFCRRSEWRPARDTKTTTTTPASSAPNTWSWVVFRATREAERSSVGPSPQRLKGGLMRASTGQQPRAREMDPCMVTASVDDGEVSPRRCASRVSLSVQCLPKASALANHDDASAPCSTFSYQYKNSTSEDVLRLYLI